MTIDNKTFQKAEQIRASFLDGRHAPGRSAVFGLFLGTLLLGGCAHRAAATNDLNSAVAPFTQARDDAVALVTTAKPSLGASDMNQLAIAYGALEVKANGYAAFLAESVSVTSLDASKNSEYASGLTKAIEVFNHAFVGLRTIGQVNAAVSSAWIPTFAESVKPYWDRYHATITAASPQTKVALVKQLRIDTVWPNFEDIATQPVSAPRPH